jgi:dinuclear metal center YbgI/SA1388 family protein
MICIIPNMKLEEFDRIMNQLLDMERTGSIDSSLNGVQVGDPDMEIAKIAFSVDASMETFKRAAECGANLVFVHHGLLWNKQKRITGTFYKRIKYLVDNSMALYAVHLPLDMHPELGNNIGIARRIGLVDVGQFGEYKGLKIGIKGSLPDPKSIEEITNMICVTRECCLGVLPFGKERIQTVGIVSGDDPRAGLEAIDDKLDCFITGASSHEIYHDCLEAGINVIFGGHYYTEVWGVMQVAEKVRESLGIDVTVLDIPTGL